MAKKAWMMIGRYDAETTTYSATAGSGVSNPFMPPFNGRLIGLRGVPGGGPATSLVNSVQFKLTSTTFLPNAIEAGVLGNGIQTAPAFKPAPIDWACDQEVRSGIGINIEARNLDADTPVTVDVQLWGCFEVYEK
jgi:hypothetical protein